MLVPSHLYYIPFLWPFYVCGNIYQRCEISVDRFFRTRFGKVLILLMAVLFILGGWLFPRQYTFYEMQNTLYENIWIIIYRYILYFASTISVLILLKVVYRHLHNKKAIRLFQWMGEHTLKIFAGHLLLIYYVFNPIGLNFMQGGGVAYYVLVPIVSFILMLLLAVVEDFISRKKILRKLLLGL